VREDDGEGAREGAEEGEEEDISSLLNNSDDGMEIELFDEGKNKTMMTRYIYIEPLVIRRAICIYVLMTLSFFSPPNRPNRLL
jgi:hypothetical protein